MDIITVIIIALIVGVIVIAIAGRKRRKEASLHINVPAPSPTLHFQAEHYRSKYPIDYNPGVTIVETNSGFSEGLIMGSMMAEREPEVIVVETPVYSDAPSFSGFGGGDSDGGGASSNWDSGSSCSIDSGSRNSKRRK